MSTPPTTCEQCGKPLEDPDFAPVCFSCLDAEITARDPAYAARRAEDQTRLALMAELGMPSNAVWKQIVQPGGWYGVAWRDYSIELLGMCVPLLPRPCPWPYVYLSTPDGQGGIAVQLWLRRVWCKETPVYVEAHWSPAHGQRIELRGLEHVRHPREAQRGLKGLTLLRCAERRGRPRGTSSYPDRQEFIAKLEEARQECQSRQERVTKTALADVLAVDRRTLYDLLKEHHVVVRGGRILTELEPS